MKLLSLAAQHPHWGAAVRYRIAQYAPVLAAAGIELKLVEFNTPLFQKLIYQPGKTGAKLIAVADALRQWLPRIDWQADAVFVQKEAMQIGPPLIERLLARHMPLIFDMDDSFWMREPSPTNGWLARVGRPASKTDELLRLSALTLVGNPHLGHYAQQHSTRVAQIPTAVACAQYTPQPDADPIPTLGWVGSHSTTSYLMSILDALRELAQIRRFRLIVVGASEPIDIAGVECINRRWMHNREIKDFQSLDIGLYPLIDTAWAWGKSAFKAIQYGAVGIPTVCTPVGFNAEVVVDGETGIHATTKDEWLAALQRLIDDQAMRRRMGLAARARIVARFSAEVHGPRLVELIRSTVCAASAGS